jgi:hypothetical protein
MLLLGDSDAPAPALAAAVLSKAVDEVNLPPPLLQLNFVKYHPNTIVVKRYL